MPILKNDAMPKLLSAINSHQFNQWKTYSADPREVAELEGEVAVLGSLFWELSNLIDDVDIYERTANKEVYAKFTDILNTRFNAENDYGYADSGTLNHEEVKNGYRHNVRWVGVKAHAREDLKKGYRKGVEWVEQTLSELVLAP